jgi:SAM-dependent MidA family methyltransferase
MNGLEAKLRRMIAVDGSMPVSQFMAHCLGDAEFGYYTTREVFGAAGDFITAPEVSQLFGEMAGVFLALAIESFEGPLTLAEFGPGRGVFMRDILRTLRRLKPARADRMRIALVETSPRLRAVQAQALEGLADPLFLSSATNLPEDSPLFVIGNEFLDALPVCQIVKSGAAWRERVVIAGAAGLDFSTGPAILPPLGLPAASDAAPDGTVFEFAPAREAVMAEIAARIAHQGGAALFFDYGHLHPAFGDTLQAMRKHAFAPVLENPGEADLTSHVDFSAFTRLVEDEGCKTAAMTQGAFLLQTGLLERAGSLGANKDAATQDSIRTAVERLAGPEAMGNLFKAFAFASGALPFPFGPARD